MMVPRGKHDINVKLRMAIRYISPLNIMNRWNCKQIVMIMIFGTLFLLWYIYPKQVDIIYRKREISTKPKIILAWNNYDDLDNWGFTRNSNKDFVDFNCKETNCVFTDDRRKLDEAHAVLFYKNLADRPPYKFTDQRWVLFSLESPCHMKFGREENLINWTQTYLPDSDIFMPYAKYYKREKPLSINFTRIVKKKQKLAAWIVSHCHAQSGRDDYVKELLNYIDVDIYGRCSPIYGKPGRCNKCYTMLNNTYKFYLAFENSFHAYYTTEKYWRTLKYFIVPIVRGDGNYDETAMPRSYINTEDFRSPRELAKYLLYLDENDDKYIEYLKHKNIYDINESRHMWRMEKNEYSFCQLCQKLNNESEPIKFYKDVRKWFGECRTPSDVTYYTNFFRKLYEILLTKLT